MAISSRRPLAFRNETPSRVPPQRESRVSEKLAHGFTLVELLVVITIIGVLVGLLLPAVQGARESARATQCINNLGQLAKAMVSYDASKGNFPGYLQLVKRNSTTWATAAYDAPSGTTFVQSTAQQTQAIPFSWAAMLLTRIERQDIWDQIISTTDTPQIRRIDSFICPSDRDVLSFKDRPGLTYVVNTGAWDRNASGLPLSGTNMGDVAANGVFFDQTVASKIQSRLSGIRDGAGTTLMLSENIHKSYDTSASTVPLFSWLASMSPTLANTLPNNPCSEQQFGMVWVVPATNGSTSPAPLTAGQTTVTVNDQEPINRNTSDAVDFRNDMPVFARPASAHRGGANVAFCDGHTQLLRDDIDYLVYQRLMTSYGKKCVDPTDWTKGLTPPNGTIYLFQTAPPLSNQDFE
jgi:prepilin-type N-terminal cleavage/methylation domain-containing protein/prepilin-type processing-associated H-X9-DG protein